MRHFTSDYVEHATLRDGTPVRLRLVTPDDKELLRRGFDGLSERSRYARFLSPKGALTPDELRYLTEVDHEDHFALGAVREPAGDHPSDLPVGLGIARFIRSPADPTTAEAAIAVADAAQGQGLGRLLFVRLVAAATERGVERFHCDVLCSNESMHQLIAGVSPDHVTKIHDGVMSIDLPLPGVSPTHHIDHVVEHGPLYRMFKLAASNAVEWTAAMRRFWHLGD
ncbi:MAG: GNAT family N-acetyltransferase [Proteobacteria bacterium]|nr:GNAT family N-acetyltransferase [Pseudomonadota bacterium]